MKHLIPTLFAVSAVASTLSAQSLFLADEGRSDTQPVILLNDVSMHFIAEPETRVIQKHDIITIIIDENSSTTSSQKLETEKESSSSANI
ncbi:MAG: hypothetical protein ACF8LL_03960, partial [Phycisphaerales bacterium]